MDFINLPKDIDTILSHDHADLNGKSYRVTKIFQSSKCDLLTHR